VGGERDEVRGPNTGRTKGPFSTQIQKSEKIDKMEVKHDPRKLENAIYRNFFHTAPKNGDHLQHKIV